MRVQHNKNTGEYRVDLGDGNFVPARVQRNKTTGEMRIMAGGQTFPYSGPGSSPSAQDLDRSTGAGYGARFAIGSAADDTTKLARARDYFGESARQEQDGGISFINPETGRRTLVNPEGFDFGDVIGSGREIASTAAGIPAGIVGGVAGGGFGSLLTGSAAASAVGAGAGQLVDSGAAWLARREAEKRGAQPSPMQSPLDAAQEAGLETALGTVGGVALGGLGRAAGKVLNPIRQDIAQAWRNMGQQMPSVASGTGGRGGAIYEEALGGMMGGTGSIQAAREAGNEAMQGALDTVARRVAGGDVAVTPYELGAFLKDAAARSKKAFRQRSDQVFSDISQKWNGQKGKLTNTMRAIDELEQGLMYNGQPTHTSNKTRQDLVGLLENELADNNYGLLNLRAIQGARQRLKKMLSTSGSFNVGDMDEGQIKYIRNALKDDYAAAITDPAELAKLNAHNQWYAGQKSTRDVLDKFVGKENAPNSLEVGEALLRSNLSPDIVRMLEQTMLPSDFATLRGGIINQLGRPLASQGMEPGQASASAVSKLLGHGKGAYAPETRGLLFGDDLADANLMAQGMAGVDRAANTSKTAQTSFMMGLLKAAQAVATGGSYALGDITGAAGAVGAPALLSKATTSPRVVNFLAKPQSGVSRAITNVLAPLSGVEAGHSFAPGFPTIPQGNMPPLESVFDPASMARMAGNGQQPGAPARDPQSYRKMLNRYGVKTSLDK